MELSIPVIDLTCLNNRNGSGAAADKDWNRVAQEFGVALHEIGFAYLVNHGIPQNIVENAFESNTSFFNLPPEVKIKYRKRMPENYHGYSEPGQEQLQSKSILEFKETFDIFGDRDLQFFPSVEVPEFQSTMEQLSKECQGLARRIFKILGLTLELEDARYFLRCSQGLDLENGSKISNPSLLRSIWYPPIQDMSSLPQDTVRCGEHTDYDIFTMLFQDDNGGLEVKSNSTWCVVKPRPGAILLNIGETLEIISGDHFPATEHRVRIPESTYKRSIPRLSIGYFVYPDTNTVHSPVKKKNGNLVADFEPFDPLARGLEKAKNTYNY